MERAEELYERLKKQGNSCIDEFILTQKSEELFLDFKLSADNGNGKRLNENDRNNLAKSISGFSNSEGGVIVWGIDCSKDFDGSDVATAKHHITNVKRFVSWLEEAISGCTIPPNTGVQNHPLEIDSGGNGFVLTYIPKSDHAPHQDVSSKKYYIRAGSNFVPILHDVLAGMFGRRPHPKIKCNFLAYPFKVNDNRIRMSVGFHISNDGPGIAEGLFVSVLALSIGGSNCSFQFYDLQEGFRLFKSINCFSAIGNLDIRLPPGGWLTIAKILLDLFPPFTQELRIEGTIGCENAPPDKFTFTNSADNLKQWYDKVFAVGNTLNEEDKFEKVKELLGI
jgi:hypothetical protein